MTHEHTDQAATKRPASRKRHPCPECGVEVVQTPRAPRKDFCTDAHRQAHANRCAQRGKALIKMAMGWRVDRGTTPIAKFCFQEMTTMLDRWAAEDREANRMRGPDYAELVVGFIPSNPQWSRTYADREAMTTKRRKAARVLKCGKGYQGCEGSVTGKAEGWLIDPPTCPNCREDVVLERRVA